MDLCLGNSISKEFFNPLITSMVEHFAAKVLFLEILFLINSSYLNKDLSLIANINNLTALDQYGKTVIFYALERTI